jgi:plastocyanin
MKLQPSKPHMKKNLLFVFAALALHCGATTFDVEVGGVGGSGVNPPYYEPQFLEIEAGDVVRWTWVGNNHNVTSTSGPESFMSGTHSSGFVFEVTFDTPGNYEYECSVGNHSNTQFGGIVVNAVSVEEPEPTIFSIYPNPATDFVVIEKDNTLNSDIRLLDITGKTIRTELNIQTPTFRMDLRELPNGIYFVEVNQKGDITRKKLMIK